MDKKKILLVDDEPAFLELLKLRLEINGYDVTTALSGQEALEKMSSRKFDAALLDIIMPDPDGLEVLRRIRKDYPDFPVFMITAFSPEDEFNQERFKVAKGLNANGFIFKAGDLSQEIKNVNTLLEILEQRKKTGGK